MINLWIKGLKKMKVSEDIKKISLKEEFRICPECGYEFGFHNSFLKNEAGKYQNILICPQCGARYDVGWELSV